MSNFGRIAYLARTHHQRVGQFISNAVGDQLYYMDDAELERRCEEYAQQCSTQVHSKTED